MFMLVYKVTHFLEQKIIGQNRLIFASLICDHLLSVVTSSVNFFFILWRFQYRLDLVQKVNDPT